MWLLVVLVVLLAGGLVYALFYLPRHVGHEGRLSLSDYANLVGLCLNVILFIVALVSLKIALNTYSDAQDTGKAQQDAWKQQQASLDASRAALQEVVRTAAIQRNLLESTAQSAKAQLDYVSRQQPILAESLDTAREQLHLIREARRLELEKPDLQIYLLYPQDVAVVVRNVSATKTAHDVRLEGRPRPDAGFSAVESSVNAAKVTRLGQTGDSPTHAGQRPHVNGSTRRQSTRPGATALRRIRGRTGIGPMRSRHRGSVRLL